MLLLLPQYFEYNRKAFWMEQHTFKNVNNCLNTNIYSYLETSSGQSFILYLNVVHFSTPVLLEICGSLRQSFSCIGVYYMLFYWRWDWLYNFVYYFHRNLWLFIFHCDLNFPIRLICSTQEGRLENGSLVCFFPLNLGFKQFAYCVFRIVHFDKIS